MRLERIALRETLVTDVAHVRLLAGVNAKVALQLVRVGRGVCAVRTLVWSLARVTTHVAFQLRQLHRSVVALVATMWLLVRVAVANVTHQLARCGEGGVAKLATMWSHSSVSVDMVLQRGQSLWNKQNIKLYITIRANFEHTLKPRSQMPHLCGRSSL